MPRSNGVYSNPGWVNGTTPAINATEMNAISDTLSTVGVANGGTGKTSHTSNSVLVGNGTNAVKNITTVSGALYSTGSGSEPRFGVLPEAQGGTGSTGMTTVTYNQESGGIKSVVCRKWGRVVELQITTDRINGGGFTSGSYVPSGYRPSSRTWFTFAGHDHSGTDSTRTRGVMTASIDPDGEIDFLSPFVDPDVTSGLWYHATVTFIQ